METGQGSSKNQPTTRQLKLNYGITDKMIAEHIKTWDKKCRNKKTREIYAVREIVKARIASRNPCA